MQFELSGRALLRRDGATPQSAEGSTDRGETSGSARWPRIESMTKWEEEICSATRRSTTDRAEARRVFALWRVVSCGSSGQDGRRTKVNLGGGEPFDDHHRSSTLGAEPKIA